MFELLTNLLIWVVALPIFIILFKSIPKEWFRYIGLLLFVAILMIAFTNLKFTDTEVPSFIIELLTFPFTLTGIILFLLFFNWRAIDNIKIRSGKEVDNSAAQAQLFRMRRGFLIALIIFAIASHNATSNLFASYFEQQGDRAVTQSYRRPVLNLTDRDREEMQRGIFDLVVVMAGKIPYELRLLEAARVWQSSDINRKPVVVLVGGERTGEKDRYPCGIAQEGRDRSRNTVRNEIASNNIGLRYDQRYINYFKDRNSPTEPLYQVPKTVADDMCVFMTRPPLGVPRSAMILITDAVGKNMRRSAEEIKNLFKNLEENRVLAFRNRPPRALLITSPLEASRAYLSFRNLGIDVVPKPVYESKAAERNSTQRPWPLQPKFEFKREYLLFSAEAFLRSEYAWDELKRLILYTLRLWVQPPLTDNPPYFPPSAPPS